MIICYYFLKKKKSNLGYLEKPNDKDIIDWKNFDGHIVAGDFIYANSYRY